jgi:hypothetical protein
MFQKCKKKLRGSTAPIAIAQIMIAQQCFLQLLYRMIATAQSELPFS